MVHASHNRREGCVVFGNGKCVFHLSRFKFQQTGAGGRGAEAAPGSGTVVTGSPVGMVVPDRAGAHTNFVTDDHRLKKIGSRSVYGLCHRERCGDDDGARMAFRPAEPVVDIQRICGAGVRQGGARGTAYPSSTRDRGFVAREGRCGVVRHNIRSGRGHACNSCGE